MNQKGTHRRGTRPFLAQEGKGAEDRPRICRAILAGCRALQRTQGSFSRLHTHTHTRAHTGGGSFCVRRAWAPSRATPARHGRFYSVWCAGAIQCFQGPNDSPCVALQLYPAPPQSTSQGGAVSVRGGGRDGRPGFTASEQVDRQHGVVCWARGCQGGSRRLRSHFQGAAGGETTREDAQVCAPLLSRVAPGSHRGGAVGGVAGACGGGSPDDVSEETIRDSIASVLNFLTVQQDRFIEKDE